MKVIKAVFNNDTTFINDIISNIDIPHIFEGYNISYLKDRTKRVREMMARYGTKNLPLVIIENENLDEVSAIWSESDPNWKDEIIKKLKE
jgi:hypothetical protein